MSKHNKLILISMINVENLHITVPIQLSDFPSPIIHALYLIFHDL